MKITNADAQHAANLAVLFNQAGEGIPEYLWSKMAEQGQHPLEVGELRAAREEGSFSYKHARICLDNSELLGMIVSYQQPDPYSLDTIDDYPKIIKPLVQLEAKAPGSWYINAIATHEQYRGKGVAQKLLHEAETLATAKGCKAMSLIVASENLRAKQLYEYIGYNVITSLPVVSYPGCLHGGNWELMVKNLH